MPQLKPIISNTLFAILFVLAISLCFSPAIHVVSAQGESYLPKNLFFRLCKQKLFRLRYRLFPY